MHRVISLQLVVLDLLVRRDFPSIIRLLRARVFFKVVSLSLDTPVVIVKVGYLEFSLKVTLHDLIINRADIPLAEFLLKLLFLGNLLLIVPLALLLFVGRRWCLVLGLLLLVMGVCPTILASNFDPLRRLAAVFATGSLGYTCKSRFFLALELHVAARFGEIFGLFLGLFVIDRSLLFVN